jgi:predicted phosphodiesterase
MLIVIRSLQPPDSAADGVPTSHLPALDDGPSAAPHDASPDPTAFLTEMPPSPADAPPEDYVDAAASVWRGNYFNTVDLTGAPVLVRDDAAIDFNWVEAAPDSQLPADGFSIRWERTLNFEADMYRFWVGADDGIRLWVDDQVIVDEWRDSPFHEVVVDRMMTRGSHTLRVDYYERVGLARVRVSWEQLTPGSDPLGADAAAAAVSFVLPPMVQWVSENGAIISFELDAPADGVLLYRVAGGELRASAFSSDRTYHQITLANLSPAAPYEYAVRVGAEGNYRQPLFAGAPWGDSTFRTPPYGPPVRIGVIGDSGYGDPVTEALVNQMAALRPDFVIHTGDVVYDMAEDASPIAAFAHKFFAPFAPVLRQGPLYPVVGNHDTDPETLWQGVPTYYYVFPPVPDGSVERRQWYTVAFGDVQFVMLDTETFFGEGGGADQQAWLAERLYDPRFSLTIPVFHVPPHTSGMHYGDGRPVEAAWEPLFQEADVALVLCGHEHFYEHLVVDGIDYVTSGGGSANLYAAGATYPGSEIVSRTSHFTMLEIYPDRITLQAIDLNGTVIDQVNITRD